MRLYTTNHGKQTSGSAIKDQAKQDRQGNSLPTKVKVKARVKKIKTTENTPYGAKNTRLEITPPRPSHKIPQSTSQGQQSCTAST